MGKSGRVPRSPKDENGWVEYKRLVMFRLDEINSHMQSLNASMTEFQKNIVRDVTDVNNRVDGACTDVKCLQTEMKIKSGVWGILGGAIPASVILAVELIKNGIVGFTKK